MASKFRWIRYLRIVHSLSAGLATWLISVLCAHGAEPAGARTAAMAIALSCMGCSLFHVGAAQGMYRRKVVDNFQTARPKLVAMLGGALLLAAIAIGGSLHRPLATAILTYNAVAVILYARLLSCHWATKNLTIALVITSPIPLGWVVAGSTHPIVLPTALFVLLAYWTREIAKDIEDIRANEGVRVTLPLWLGVRGATRIAAAFSAIALILLLDIGTLLLHSGSLPLTFYGLALALFTTVVATLGILGTHRSAQRRIAACNWLLIGSLFSTIVR